ncbi:MAG TPA: pyridoxal-phosphate dependent enzyme [Saprospiraceae bacterium]|nr:pyridoxal-phosphate dependent enzyme [Saprospiraceae bacterium]
MLFQLPVSILTRLDLHPGTRRGIRLYLKRDDLLHPEIDGSKARKLSALPDLVKAHYPGGIVTFGGAFSNHLHAVSVLGRMFNIPTRGILRGSYVDLRNPTLHDCSSNGMELIPVPKTSYQEGKQDDYAYWRARFPDAFLLPEGGNMPEAVAQCRRITAEILTQLPESDQKQRLVICCPAGTGCTAAGVASGLTPERGETWIFPVSEDGLHVSGIRQLLPESLGYTPEIRWIPDYVFGGFAKYQEEVMAFVQRFYQQYQVLPDPVYTAKMLFGIFDLLAKGQFEEDSTVVVLMTGGQQGWRGFIHRYGSRKFVEHLRP